jgi:hypothetical protein
MISQFVTRVCAQREYEVRLIGAGLLEISAWMTPVWKRPDAMGREVPKAQIMFCLPVCRRSPWGHT